MNACVYDGYCSTTACAYQCEVGAKANSAYRTVPAAIKTGNFSMALNSYAFRLDTDSATGNVTAARYYDASGNVHVQPAKVFFNGLWGHNIPRLMALSGVGNPYNPQTVTGQLGRGVTFGTTTGPGTASISGTFGFGGNAYGVGNAAGGAVDIYDFADDNFDHTGLNFIGGSVISMGQYIGGPNNYNGIAGVATAASMGSAFKASLKNHYLPTKTTVTVSPSAPELADTRWNVDLDPHYNDIYGDPLARVMYDWTANAYNGAVYLVNKVQPILQKMGATNITTNKGVAVGTVYHADSWVAHTRGGARIGSDPATSVFNKYHQSWTNQNLFAAGEITNTTGNNVTPGTHMMGAECYVAAEGIKNYLASPGPL